MGEPVRMADPLEGEWVFDYCIYFRGFDRE